MKISESFWAVEHWNVIDLIYRGNGQVSKVRIDSENLLVCASGIYCSPSCPLGAGWVSYNGSCYLFSNQKLKYTEAFAECGQLDSDLLYFYSESDRVMLIDRMYC